MSNGNNGYSVTTNDQWPNYSNYMTNYYGSQPANTSYTSYPPYDSGSYYSPYSSYMYGYNETNSSSFYPDYSYGSGYSPYNYGDYSNSTNSSTYYPDYSYYGGMNYDQYNYGNYSNSTNNNSYGGDYSYSGYNPLGNGNQNPCECTYFDGTGSYPSASAPYVLWKCYINNGNGSSYPNSYWDI